MNEKVGIDIVVNSSGAKKEADLLTGAFTKLSGVVAGFSAADFIKDQIMMADKMTGLEQRIKYTVKSFEDFESAMESISEISLKTGASLETTGKLFLSVAEAAQNMGRSQGEALKLVDTLQKIKLVYGINGDSFNNAIQQLEQSLGAGVLNGDELKSILENARPIVSEIAKGLGVSVGNMKQLGAEGKLTTEKVFDALLKRTEDINKRLKDAPTLISAEWDKLKAQIDQTTIQLNKFLGVTDKIAGAIAGIRENFQYLLDPSKFIKSLDTSSQKNNEGISKKLGAGMSAKDSGLQEAFNKNIAEEEARKRAEYEEKNPEKFTGRSKNELLEKQKGELGIKPDNQENFTGTIDGILKDAEEKRAQKEKIDADNLERDRAQLVAKNESFEAIMLEFDIKEQNRQAMKYESDKFWKDKAQQDDLQRFSRHEEMVDFINNFEKKSTAEKNAFIKNQTLDILTQAGTFSKKAFEVSKALNLADAIMQGYGAVQKAYNAVPPPYNLALVAMTVARTAVQVKGIRSQKFGGGSSYSPASGGSAGGISDRFDSSKLGDSKIEEKREKNITIQIAEGNLFSAKSVRELIKAINEETGNNITLSAA